MLMFLAPKPANSAKYLRRSIIMPKLKTHSGAKKRFKLSKNGKVIRGSCQHKSHLLNGHGKTPKSKSGPDAAPR